MADGTVWTAVPGINEAAYESQFRGRTDLSYMDCALTPAKSTLNRRPHGYPNRLAVRSTVGAGGFEPPTSRTRTVRSIRTEPRPDRIDEIIPQAVKDLKPGLTLAGSKHTSCR